MFRSGELIVPDGNGGAITVPPYEEILESARRRFESYESTVGRLSARIAELESETYADEKMAEMKAEVEEARRAMSRGFCISDEEWDKIHAWQREHLRDAHGIDDEHQHLYAGATGGAWTFTFIPTSIGVIGRVSCHCGEKLTFQELG